MYSAVILSGFCVVLCTIICKGAPTSSKNMSYYEVKAAYINFLTSPPPRQIIVRTRDFLKEPVKAVNPIGLVLYRCPKTVGIEGAMRSCHHTDIEEVKLEVSVTDLEDKSKKIVILPENHTLCECQ